MSPFSGLILFRILYGQIICPLLQPFPHLHRLLRNLAAEADVPSQQFEGLRDLIQPCLNGIVRFCPVQFTAFSQQVGHSLFLNLAVGIQLGQCIYAVVQQKLHLPDAFV